MNLFTLPVVAFLVVVDAAQQVGSQSTKRIRGSSNRVAATTRNRHLKSGGKGNVVDAAVVVAQDSCSNLERYYQCDGPGSVAICYKHDDHYHNKCLDDYNDDDIFNKVPGVDLYKDKYELVTCGCCPEEHVHNNVIEEIKYPKSYKKDPYCDRITPTPTLGPSTSPSTAPSESPSTAPSETPSTSPSTAPSEIPSSSPSSSQPPSTSPSTSKAPSNRPSESPSELPSEAPSVACGLGGIIKPYLLSGCVVGDDCFEYSAREEAFEACVLAINRGNVCGGVTEILGTGTDKFTIRAGKDPIFAQSYLEASWLLKGDCSGYLPSVSLSPSTSSSPSQAPSELSLCLSEGQPGYLFGCVGDISNVGDCDEYDTQEEAFMACVSVFQGGRIPCGGVTFNPDSDKYTIREGSTLRTSPSGETSWFLTYACSD